MDKRPMINYEQRENCFVKCEHVKSRLVWGDESVIPKPWITVVMPTYRRPHLLKEALYSVLKQQHTDFLWDIIIVDNEPDDGKENDTERLVRQVNDSRILYYRNSENIWVGDNFNRCFSLARGEWVAMLHDDDLLMSNALKTIGFLIRAYDTKDRPLGAIAASYVQVEYDPVLDSIKEDIHQIDMHHSQRPISMEMYHITHNNVKAFAHIGGAAPTNGSTFRRRAVIDIGGFNESHGISGDLMLFYRLENEYAVYQTLAPIGFYRWGVNSMMNKDSLHRVINDNFEYREYIYQKSRVNQLVGKLLRNCHYRCFSMSAIEERVRINGESICLSDFDDIYNKRPNIIWYIFYKVCIAKAYGMYKKLETKKNAKIATDRITQYYKENAKEIFEVEK